MKEEEKHIIFQTLTMCIALCINNGAKKEPAQTYIYELLSIMCGNDIETRNEISGKIKLELETNKIATK